MRSLAVVAMLFLLGASPANGGRRRHGWLLDTDLLPQRGVELEWWLTEWIADDRTQAWLAAYGVVGLTDTVELALPIEVRWDRERGTELTSYGIEARWRLVSPDPARAGPVVPVLRAGVARVIPQDAARLEAGAALSVDLARRLRVIVDAGVLGRTGSDDVFLIYGAGLSVAVAEEVFVGAEAYGGLAFEEPGDAWLAVGPSLAVSYGRFWLTASLPIGITARAPDVLPRVIWAMAF